MCSISSIEARAGGLNRSVIQKPHKANESYFATDSGGASVAIGTVM
jgi:hypothetical protein